MRLDPEDELFEECPGVAVEVEVMRKNPRGLRRVGVAFAARAEMRNQALDRRFPADEEPPSPPGDQVDVRIALHKGRRDAGTHAERR